MKHFFEILARPTRHLLVLFGFFALAFSSSHGLAVAQSSYQTLVRVDEVRTEPLKQVIPLIGSLVAKRTGDVAVEVNGAVKQILVEVGQAVKQGQLIAVLKSDTRQAQKRVLENDLDQSIALLEIAKVELAIAKQKMDRQARLKKTGAFNRALFENTLKNHAKALVQITRAQSAIASKRATIAVMNLEIEKLNIRSPYAGIVLERKTEKGAYVRSGDPVIRLIADKQLEIEANVPALRLGGLEKGVVVDAELEDGTRFKATVRASLPVENPRTRTRPVRFAPIWPKNIARLAASQSVTLFLPAGVSRQVVTVHKDAVVSKRIGNVVFIIENGKAVSRKVKLGVSSGPRLEVMAGLKPGDQAVVRGNERLRPGQSVKIRKGT